MRRIVLVLLFCVAGCAESHPTMIDGDSDVTIVGDAGIENDSSIAPNEDGGMVEPDAGSLPDSGVEPDTGVDASGPTCGRLPADVFSHHDVLETDCDGPMRLVQWVDVAPVIECSRVNVRVMLFCLGMPTEVRAVGEISGSSPLVYRRVGLTYTSEPFLVACEGTSYTCSLVHDGAGNALSLSCDYEGLSCESTFAP